MILEKDKLSRGYKLFLSGNEELKNRCSLCHKLISNSEEFYLCSETQKVFHIKCHQDDTNGCFKGCVSDLHEHTLITQVISKKTPESLKKRIKTLHNREGKEKKE